ncbi:MAG: helix-turn-helix transcriptional regulator [Ruminococcaceae bacterium]|nr:helix-turn-helix transcriptional regulator [Oscillospiraceae bacterium]
MKLNLGTTIRELRRRDERTQEELAVLLGVTAQAVSRWESGGSYPDMELIPAIANVFGISIDELFGYQGEREAKIDAILAQVDALDRQNIMDDVTNDDCITLLRTGLAEFPGNERLTHRLAKILAETGWQRHREWLHYGEDGHIQHCFDRHKTNEYWLEAAALYETLIQTAQNDNIRNKSIGSLVMLYRNFGEYDKALALADRLPPLSHCKEITRTNAVDGKEQAQYLGEALLELAYQFVELTMYALVNDIHHYDTDMPVHKVKGLIALFDFLCDDGNLGYYHKEVAYLYLYLARLQWDYAEYHDEAFASLDRAADHAIAYDRVVRTPNARYSAPLVKHVPVDLLGTGLIGENTLCGVLAESFPMWCNPDYSKVEQEMRADARWEMWEKKLRDAAAFSHICRVDS